jgi:biotin transport system substrate-specific component
MLHTLSHSNTRTRIGVRLAGVGLFTLLTVLSARVTLEIGTPVPVTLQTLVVMLAGLVLGSRDGAASQAAYLGLLLLNLPVDARMTGLAALAGPTAGFLYGFPVLAFVTGWLTERGANRLWLRWSAALVGTAALYLLGWAWLKAVTGMTFGAAFVAAVQPFIVVDMVKALVAAAFAEAGRALLRG